MYREYSRNDVVAQTLIKSLLVVATGCEPAKEVLQRACAKYEIGTKGNELSFLKFQENSSSAPTELVSRSRGQGRPAGDTPPQESPIPLQQTQSKRVDDALHDIIRYLEHAVDVLIQRQVGELVEEDEERLRIICSRLLKICRLDIAEWSTVSAFELLGSIAKGTVLFSSPTPSSSTLTLKKGRVLSTVPQRRPVVMTDEMLTELEQLEKRERLRLPVQRIRVLLQP
ncbi:hypothetical protein CPB86DRAFT_16968 [Serendipita vermifera]|nr:hypothetical protein CPB86DRAFT_16968 [Serendipita vermifera]